MNTETLSPKHQSSHDEHHDVGSKVIFGFWIFILSDCVLFSILFAAYAVLHKNTFGAIGIKQVASLPYTLVETLVLLTSNLTFGLGMSAFSKSKKGNVLFWLALTFILGGIFAYMGAHEFSALINSGESWHKSAFLSSFFTLVGMHWFHLLAGLLWILILMTQVIGQGTTDFMRIRLTCFGLFWHFLNIVWLFIFTIVYLMGAL